MQIVFTKPTVLCSDIMKHLYYYCYKYKTLFYLRSKPMMCDANQIMTALVENQTSDI